MTISPQIGMLVYHDRYMEHVQWGDHVESPERLEYILRKLEVHHLFSDVLSPEEAPVELITSVHSEEYVEMIKNYGEGPIDPDTYIHDNTYEIARLAVGGTVAAAERSFEERRPAMALVRPPGHHAGADYAKGFCYFNNIAIAANRLLRQAKKVAVVDIDVHHGNGTSDILQGSDKALYISTHQWGIFPGTGPIGFTGADQGEGFTVNIPFTTGCGDSTYEMAFEKVVEPIVEEFGPGMILVSLGVDAHYRDPLASLALSSQGYLELASRLMKLAEKLCENRICFALEGGYNLHALSEVVAGIVGSFAGKSIDFQYTDVFDQGIRGEEIVNAVLEVQKEYWDL